MEPNEEIVIRPEEHDGAIVNDDRIGSTSVLNGQFIILHGFAYVWVAELSGDSNQIIVVNRDNDLAGNP